MLTPAAEAARKLRWGDTVAKREWYPEHVFMLETLTFVNAVLFLIGIVLMVAGSFPQVRERAPKLFLNGFLVTLAGLASMLVAAFAFSPAG